MSWMDGFLIRAHKKKKKTLKSLKGHHGFSEGSGDKCKEDVKMAHFWKKGGTHVSGVLHAFPSSNPVDQISAD